MNARITKNGNMLTAIGQGLPFRKEFPSNRQIDRMLGKCTQGFFVINLVRGQVQVVSKIKVW